MKTRFANNAGRIQWVWWCQIWGVLLCALAARGEGVDLLQLYPTTLLGGDAAPERARSVEFTADDIFRLTKFHLEAGNDMRVDVGPADVGIGHCADGAVWAVVIPREDATVTSAAFKFPEPIAAIWLRFHPKQIIRFFSSDDVFRDGARPLGAAMRRLADFHISGSWQAGGRALIPDSSAVTVDVDTKAGPRRFFTVDLSENSATYRAAFEKRVAVSPPALTPKAAQEAFDKLWEAFDRDYAMFTLRPEVDWNASRSHFRPLALACRSTDDLAAVCAEMLRPLRDLHVWLTDVGMDVPVYGRPRAANANPAAHRSIMGSLANPGQVVQWTITNKIGFLAIYSWNDASVPNRCDDALEKMMDAQALIVDVRMNGGGSEDLAQAVAARFIDKPFVYAYDQLRNGPSHTNLTDKIPRVLQPRAPYDDRPVILLIGQKCMSSAESFVAMMSGDTNLTTMGDHTCGSSGNPEIIKLPLGLAVSVPQWIDFLPDGSPLDERGFQPQIKFVPQPGAFEGERDDLLTAALERLALRLKNGQNKN